MQLSHGGDWAGYQEECGTLPLDFSSNISPLGLPKGVQSAYLTGMESVERYPDPLCRTLRERIATKYGVPTDFVLCGNGAADLIDRLVLALLPAHGLVVSPTFSEYAQALKRVGCTVEKFPLMEDKSFQLSDELLSRIDLGLDILFLCEPNNPTGLCTCPDLLQRILQRCSERDVLLAVDECFLDFVEDGDARSLITQLKKNRMIVFRSFTKLYAMPGLRLGYCLSADLGLLERMRLAGQPWAVSTVAQIAGLAALQETEYVEKVRQTISVQRTILMKELNNCGCHVIPGQANYLLFYHPEMDLAKKLRKMGILIRDCCNFSGLSPGWFRVAVRTELENQHLIEAIRRCVY